MSSFYPLHFFTLQKEAAALVSLQPAAYLR
jgi:hypothetical protein